MFLLFKFQRSLFNINAAAALAETNIGFKLSARVTLSRLQVILKPFPQTARNGSSQATGYTSLRSRFQFNHRPCGGGRWQQRRERKSLSQISFDA